MHVLSANNITKNFGKRTVLNDVSLSINAGDFVAIVGASGSGKSTLLTILGGIDTPTSGSVFLKDTDITTLNERSLAILRRSRLGFVFQFFNLAPALSAAENIMLPIVLSGKSVRGYKDKMLQLMDYLGILEHKDKLPGKLSGGEQQRVAIARSLIFDPDVLLLDEPTGNLDSESSLGIMELLKSINKQKNTAIVMVTHSTECAAYADRIVTIKDGVL